MALLLKELSSLEVEPLEIALNAPGQERSLYTLAGSEVAVLPTNDGGGLGTDSGGTASCFHCCDLCCYGGN